MRGEKVQMRKEGKKEAVRQDPRNPPSGERQEKSPRREGVRDVRSGGRESQGRGGKEEQAGRLNGLDWSFWWVMDVWYVWMGGWEDGWRMDVWMDGWMDGWVGISAAMLALHCTLVFHPQ